MTSDSRTPAFIAVSLVALSLRQGELHVALAHHSSTTTSDTEWSLPGDYLGLDESAEQTAQRRLSEVFDTCPKDVELDQLHTYSHPDQRVPSGRVVDVGWLALGRYPASTVTEDVKTHGLVWVPVRKAMAWSLQWNHGQMLTDGLTRIRHDLEHTKLATAFVGPEFTMSELRKVYEAIWDQRLEPANFHRKILSVPGFVEPTGVSRNGRGRPAQLYRAGHAQAISPPLSRRLNDMSNA